GGEAQRPAPDGDAHRRGPPERAEAAARVGAGRLGGARPDAFVSPVNRRGPDADRLAALRRPARRPGGSDVLPAAAVRVAVVTAGGARLGALGPRAADGADGLVGVRLPAADPRRRLARRGGRLRVLPGADAAGVAELLQGSRGGALRRRLAPGRGAVPG